MKAQIKRHETSISHTWYKNKKIKKRYYKEVEYLWVSKQINGSKTRWSIQWTKCTKFTKQVVHQTCNVSERPKQLFDPAA